MADKKRRFPSIVGGSSLLVIFAVLCLSVFSILTISTAKAQEHFAKVNSESISAFYEADSKAEEIFATIRSGTLPSGVKSNKGIYSYSCMISETLYLQVEVTFENGSWNVLRWEAVSTNV